MLMAGSYSFLQACGEYLLEFSLLCVSKVANKTCRREIAYGNTFGGWALPSYGAFWIGLGIIFTPGGFDIVGAYGGQNKAFYDALGFYIFVRPPFLSLIFLLSTYF